MSRRVRFIVRQVERPFNNTLADCANIQQMSPSTPFMEGLYREYLTIQEARAVKKQNPKELEIVRVTTTIVS